MKRKQREKTICIHKINKTNDTQLPVEQIQIDGEDKRKSIRFSYNSCQCNSFCKFKRKTVKFAIKSSVCLFFFSFLWET